MTYRHLKTVSLLPGYWIRTPILLGGKTRRSNIPRAIREAASRARQARYAAQETTR